MQAITLRVSSEYVKTSLTTYVQPIAAYNYWTECVSPTELESIRYEPETLRLEALLILKRLLLLRNSIDLIDCNWAEGWEYTFDNRYDRCIYL
jgi:hypothetical protein